MLHIPKVHIVKLIKDCIPKMLSSEAFSEVLVCTPDDRLVASREITTPL